MGLETIHQLDTATRTWHTLQLTIKGTELVDAPWPAIIPREKWERLQGIVDDLNYSHGKRVVTLGAWTPPPGGFAGGKIAFTRIPDAEDFL